MTGYIWYSNLISLGLLLLFDAKSPMQNKDAFLSTSNIISPVAPAAASPTVHKHTAVGQSYLSHGGLIRQNRSNGAHID